MKKNFLYQICYQILVIILPFFTTPYISRVLGAEGIGLFSYTFSVVSYFEIFILLGISVYGNRKIAQIQRDVVQRQNALNEIYCVQLISSVIVLSVYLTYCMIFNTYEMLYYVFIVDILSHACDITWYYWGVEKFKLVTSVNMIVKLFSVLAVFVFVKTRENVVTYAFILSISGFLSQIFMWHFERPKDLINVMKSGEFSQHVKPILLLFLPVIIVSVYKIMDKIMLGILSDHAQVGFYHMAEKFTAIPMAIINSLNIILMPRISNLVATNNNQDEEKLLKTSVFFTSFFSVSLSLGLCAIAPQFIPLFLGDGYSETISVLYILSPVIIILSFEQILRLLYITPHSLDKEYIISVVIGAILNLFFNLVFIPKYFALGAAMGTLLAESSVCLYQCFVVRKKLPLIEYFLQYITCFIPGLSMFLLIKLLPNSGNVLFDLIMKIFIGIVIYISISIPIMIRSNNALWRYCKSEIQDVRRLLSHGI